ncbi:MAG: M14 family zinc carboxypeptidase [Candidatus Thorarchaeota archaeon]
MSRPYCGMIPLLTAGIMLLSSILTFPPSNVSATTLSSSTIFCEPLAAPSINRTWGAISLLYENQYHDPMKTQEEIDRIHDLVPDLIDLEVIGQSFLGRNITSLRITNELNPVQKAKTLVVAHHHGREQITVEMALRFILHIVNNYGDYPDITRWVDTQEIYVIPTLNPDALDLVVNQKVAYSWLRKNVRAFDNDNDGLFDEDHPDDADGDGSIVGYIIWPKSNFDDYYWQFEGIDNDGDGLVNEDEVGYVDLNRNYDANWEWAADAPPESPGYAGPEPFSESETQALRDFAVKHRFAMAFSLHSGINRTFFPTNESDQYPYYELYQEMASDLQRILPASYSSPLTLNYDNSAAERNQRMAELTGIGGLWQKWMLLSRNSIVPISFEVYGNASCEQATATIVDNATHIIEDRREFPRKFNPVEPFIDDLWQDIRPAFDYLLRMTPRLEIDPEVISSEGNTVIVRFSIRNLSPRLGSVDLIEVLGAYKFPLGTCTALSAGLSRNDTIKIQLPASLGAKDYIIRIGNNYTGYSQIAFSKVSATTDSAASSGFAWTILVILLLLTVIWEKMYRYSARSRSS